MERDLVQQPNWYAITGGPCSGKTTIIEELEKRGYNIVKESARLYIKQQLKQGHLIAQIRNDEKAFQEAVFKHKQTIHDSLSGNTLTFLDRGYHDTIGYLKYHGYDIAQNILKISSTMKYKKVFALDMLPYVQDDIRIESNETAQGLHDSVLNAYRQSGHEIVSVPVMPVKKRADFLLENL